MDENPNMKEIFSKLDKWIDEKEKYCEKIERLLDDLKKKYKIMADKIENIPKLEKEIKNIGNSNRNSKKKEMSDKRLELSTLNNDITTDQSVLAKIMHEIDDIIDGNEERRLHKGVSKNLLFGPKIISDKLLFGPSLPSSPSSKVHTTPKAKEPNVQARNDCEGPQCPQQGGKRSTRSRRSTRRV